MSPMPPILSNPTRAAHVAIGFVTIGALLMVNTAVVHCYMWNHDAADATVGFASKYYWNAAFFFSGMTLFALGFGLGSIGRSGRKAELPPEVSSAATSQPAVVVDQPAVVPIGEPVAGQAVAFGQAVLPPPLQAARVAPLAPVAPLHGGSL